MVAIPLIWQYPRLSRWEAMLEEEHDNKWMEGGEYRFICDHCDEIVMSLEPKVYRPREYLTCPNCNRRNAC